MATKLNSTPPAENEQTNDTVIGDMPLENMFGHNLFTGRLHVELTNESDEDDSGDDHCHPRQATAHDNSAERVLLIVTMLTGLFVIGEFTGGYLSKSLAIMTDAGHLLSDLLSFVVAIIAQRVARRPATQRLSFGYYRAEVLSAVLSILIIWLLTGVLVYEAIQRCIHMDFTLEPVAMIATASAAVLFNLIMAAVLRWGGARIGHAHGHSHGGHGHSHADHAHSHSHDGDNGTTSNERQANINVRAAFIHVLGDLLQSIGVLIASIIVFFDDKLKLADPICTFIFSVLVMITTITVMRDAVTVLMEAAPRNIRYDDVCRDLLAIDGVERVHSLHLWELTAEKTAAITHLVTNEQPYNWLRIQRAANTLLRRHYGAHFVNVQVEPTDQRSEKCVRCRPIGEYDVVVNS